ncbi:MAG: M20/M25/M40 family metallo-hydrolase [Proteobacteria bacterium]|nr:M20/M25/M40 family metallo-hydrolase [Pseudomonadota bacterium]
MWMRLMGSMLALACCCAVAARAEAPANARTEARAILERIVAIPSAAGLGKVPAVAQYLADRFRAAGFPEDDIHVLHSGDTASLVVRYRGSGKGGRPILLIAHMDVVTAKPEDWERDPFKLVEENGYFFGRGTMDVKGEIALISATFLRLKAEGFVPTRDLIIAFSGDEETQMDTARELATRYRALTDAEFALNGDGGGGTLDDETGKPQFYALQGAEKSYASFALTSHNPGGHSSQPRPDNAIYELADALKAVQGYAFPVMWNDWTLGSFKATAPVTPGELGQAMAKFAANPGDAEAAAVLAKNPAMVGRTRTTCVATMLTGGHADNALPQSATATVNCRIFPGTSVTEVRDSLQKVVGDKIEVKVIGEPHASPPSPLRSDVLAAVTKAVRAGHPGVPIVPDMAPYATDGSIFRGAGIPTYGVSSLFMKEKDEFAHGLNERVPVAAFYAGLDHWYVLLTTLAGAK